MNKDLEIIKKKYGENMAHLCRELFPTVLLEEGKLPEILQDNFPTSKNLYTDIKENNYDNCFQSFLISKANIKVNVSETTKSPFELLKEAGYTLYECTNRGEIDRFKKYYEEKELLCTFHDPERLKRNYVFFAIKDNADKLKREDFKNPDKEDEYSKSVIGIQFKRGKFNQISIKSRYNTTISDPDSMFSNNLENIIPGLTKSFEKEYNLNVYNSENEFNLSNYIFANDKRFYRYYCYSKENTKELKDNNIRPKSIYYCENNIIIDGDTVIRDYNMPERYIFMDNYILDLDKKNRRVFKYKDDSPDGFIDDLKDISKVDIIRDKKTNKKKVIIKKENGDEVEIVLNQNNNIIKYKNDNLVNAGENFLSECVNLETFECPNLRKAGKKLLARNRKLKEFNQPLLEEVPDGCLAFNEIIEKVNVDNATRIGDDFLNDSRKLKEFNANNATEIGYGVLQWNQDIESINIPIAKKIDSYFANMAKNVKINGSNEVLDLVAEEIGDGVLSHHETFKKANLNNAKVIGAAFLADDKNIETINAKNLTNIGSSFLSNGIKIKELDFENVTEIGDDCLLNNTILDKINIKNAEIVGHRFLKNNENLRKIEANNLVSHGEEFISNNRKVKVQAPNLSFKDRLYTNHIRKIKKTFEVIKKLSIYNRKSLSTNQEVVRGNYEGQMYSTNNDLDNMFSDNYTNNNDYGRWR